MIDWHREMIGDMARTGTYRRAILSTVRPGDVVLDLGSGTGILALFACQAGAARVYAIERTDMVRVAREIFKANGVDERVRLLKGLSTELAVPERVDVIVSEVIGSFGLEEGLLRYLVDARERFLKPGARLVPSELELFLAPSEDGKIQDRLEVWRRAETMHGVNLLPAHRLAAENVYEVGADPGDFLADPACLKRIDLRDVRDIHMKGNVHFEVARPGRLTGLAGWFRVKLGEGIWLSTEPPLKHSSWENMFFPLDRPCDVRPGDMLDVTVSFLDPFWRWTIEVSDGTPGVRKARYAHSTFRGFPISGRDMVKYLASRAPSFSGPARVHLEALVKAMYRFCRAIVG